VKLCGCLKDAWLLLKRSGARSTPTHRGVHGVSGYRCHGCSCRSRYLMWASLPTDAKVGESNRFRSSRIHSLRTAGTHRSMALSARLLQLCCFAAQVRHATHVNEHPLANSYNTKKEVLTDGANAPPYRDLGHHGDGEEHTQNLEVSDPVGQSPKLH
jgi:hypothetical protein